MLVVGDVVGHGLPAGRRSAFVRTAFAATTPFSDDPGRLLSWANAALIERAGISSEFVTAACVTYLPSEQHLRWAYAGHPPALWLDDGSELGRARAGNPTRGSRRPRMRGGFAAVDGRRGSAVLHRRADRSTARRQAVRAGRRVCRTRWP